MSRSNPTSNAPNPSSRFYEWDGENGKIRYYDKELVVEGKTKKGGNVVVGDKFTFIVLDELATIRGWHEPSESGIYANEVRDTRQEAFVVKSFKGQQIASGFYGAIKDRVNAAGGNFTANIYIGYREGDVLKLGSLQLKGAALNSWVDFRKAHRGDIQTKAVSINGSIEGKKGKVVFKTPKFFIKDITEETNTQAIALDKELQAYLAEYFKRSTVEKAQPATAAHPAEAPQPDAPQDTPPYEPEQEAPPVDADEPPF